jgi:hypothetical protein
LKAEATEPETAAVVARAKVLLLELERVKKSVQRWVETWEQWKALRLAAEKEGALARA